MEEVYTIVNLDGFSSLHENQEGLEVEGFEQYSEGRFVCKAVIDGNIQLQRQKFILSHNDTLPIQLKVHIRTKINPTTPHIIERICIPFYIAPLNYTYTRDLSSYTFCNGVLYEREEREIKGRACIIVNVVGVKDGFDVDL